MKTKLSKKETDFIANAEGLGYKFDTLKTENGDRGIIRSYNAKLSNILPNDYNPNKTSKRVDSAINESIATFGQVAECIARINPNEDSLFQIIDGEHRYRESLESKITSVSINVLFGYTDAEFKKLTIILNETRGKADKIELASLLYDLNSELEGNLITGLPYSSDELSELLDIGSFDWEDFNANSYMGEGGDPDNDGNLDDDEFTYLTVKVSKENLELINQAKEMIEKSDSKLVEWGEILYLLADFYLKNMPSLPE